ncbi:acetyltransferase [Rivularia sp. PCC 7116]|uniref:GNAT family N-acetyltransferase n=1 Tax=Rivularia sp. PCC 7116 TaxID=373994 RepID=UPI00029F0BDF|nr:GNAT family N-acetyltransferase [Rivularia sp. PCC 7116]AFY52917.1 acetyltransferase [Rivularia sp. PCC 7116]
MIEFKIVDNNNAIAQVSKLAKNIWNEHYLPIIGNHQVSYMLDKFQSEDAIGQHIDEGYRYYMIFYNQVEAGYFSICEKGEKLFLSKLYILKYFRGKGIGKQAIEFIKSNLKNPVIQLTVNKNNSDSLAFYKNIGFEIVDDVVMDIGNGFVMDDYVMEMAS